MAPCALVSPLVPRGRAPGTSSLHAAASPSLPSRFLCAPSPARETLCARTSLIPMASSPAGSPAPELPLPVNGLSPGVRLLSPLVLPSKSPDRATSMELPSVLPNSWPRPSARSPMPHPAPALLAVELASDPCLPRSCAPSPCCVRRGFLPLRARLFRSFLCSIPWLCVEPLAQAASCLFAVVEPFSVARRRSSPVGCVLLVPHSLRWVKTEPAEVRDKISDILRDSSSTRQNYSVEEKIFNN
jgi:hypothetical protein